MTDFAPVDLVSKDGRPFTARSAVQLNNLLARGYKPVAPEPEQPSFADNVIQVPPTPTPETPPAEA